MSVSITRKGPVLLDVDQISTEELRPGVIELSRVPELIVQDFLTLDGWSYGSTTGVSFLENLDGHPGVVRVAIGSGPPVASGGGGNADFSYGAITTVSSSSTTTWSSVPGSDVSVLAGKSYQIKWSMRTYSAANTTGVGLRRVLGGGAAGAVLGFSYKGMSNATAAIFRTSREGTVDEFIGVGNATSTTTASGLYEAECIFECTTSGTLGLEMRSEVASSAATIDGDGSYWSAISRTT